MREPLPSPFSVTIHLQLHIRSFTTIWGPFHPVMGPLYPSEPPRQSGEGRGFEGCLSRLCFSGLIAHNYKYMYTSYR